MLQGLDFRVTASMQLVMEYHGRPPGHKPGPFQPKSDTASHSGCPDVDFFFFFNISNA